MLPPNDGTTNEYLQKSCPVCNNQEFEWGRMGAQAYYVPGTRMWSMKGRQVIRTRRCLRCNNLLQFTDQELTRTQGRMTISIMAAAIVFAFVLVIIFAIIPLLLMHPAP